MPSVNRSLRGEAAWQEQATWSNQSPSSCQSPRLKEMGTKLLSSLFLLTLGS